MAPLVVAPVPDLTDSEEEKNEPTATNQSVKKSNEDINSTSPADASEPATAQSVKNPMKILFLYYLQMLQNPF